LSLFILRFLKENIPNLEIFVDYDKIKEEDLEKAEKEKVKANLETSPKKGIKHDIDVEL
jgi:hypothetical protein